MPTEDTRTEETDSAPPSDVWLQPEPPDIALADAWPEIVRKFKRLQELEQRFEQALEREKLESLRQFAYGASHEINNPLANIATRAQSLLRDEVDPERRRKLATVVTQAFRAHEMISDLMLFARPPALNRTTWAIEPLVREVVQELSSEAVQQRTEILVQVNNALLLRADRTQLAVAIKALVRNALEVLVEGGRIEVSAESLESRTTEPSQVAIRVRDNGPGIAPEIRAHLFDPFFSGREAGRGLGFGLPKCWRIITTHGGTISVESTPGDGACFSIQLPSVVDDDKLRRTDEAHPLAKESHTSQSEQRVKYTTNQASRRASAPGRSGS